MFLIILSSMLIGDLLWWRWADRRARHIRWPTVWRTLVAIFIGSQLLYLLWMFLFPTPSRRVHGWMPAAPLAAIYIWHVLVLPATLLAILLTKSTTGLVSLARRLRRRSTRPPQPQFDPTTPLQRTRRQVLAAAALGAGPLLLTAAVGRAIPQTHQFRVRRLDVPLPGLPAALDGMTIAHVSDLHIGRFMRPHMLPPVIDAINRLQADLVLHTGDLIDLSLDDLPIGLNFVRKLHRRSGLIMIQGNHDLIDDPVEFELRVKASGVPLLLNESATVVVRDHPLQLLGLTWSRSDPSIAAAMAELQPQRDPAAFQILLAHHPHAFDAAAATNIPLTLSGHTHGGQIMLTEHFGAGAAMFRYVSGLYRKLDSGLVVSNGIGNWFPLRINAPAEVVHITLRAAPTS